MPPRLSKRQQREKEELDALANPLQQEQSGDIFEEEIPSTKAVGVSKGPVGFAALLGSDDTPQEEEVSEEELSITASKSKKSKKKKKKSTAATTAEDSQGISSPVVSKAAKGKGKSKDTRTKGPKTKAEEDAEFEKALAELSGKYSTYNISDTKALSPAATSAQDALHSLLGVSLKNLDPETELRRFFGSRVISSSGSGTSPKNSNSRVKSNFARPQANWPPAQYRAGLTIRALAAGELNGKGPMLDARERWWTVEASPRYIGTTYEYLQCVMGGDPQLFYNLMYDMPWHADTLLQLAEVYRHREEYSTAADFMARTLFAYERAFTGAFNLTSGYHRLDFDRVENRVFYLAVARNVVDLNRRGTPRTAFEYARLLFGLDPYTDPHGALLHLDYLAIKANQIDWLLGVWDAYIALNLGKEEESRVDPTVLPGWNYARALALFEKEGESDEAHAASTEALKKAIQAFPSVIPLLCDKLDTPLPSELINLDAFRIVLDYNPYRDNLPTSLLHLLSHIYVLRSHSLWKLPSHSSWLSRTISSLNPSDITSPPSPLPFLTRFHALFSHASNLTDAIYRHVLVVAPLSADFRRLLGFFSVQEKQRMENTIEGDPLPPMTAVSVYNDAYFHGVSEESGRGGTRSGGRGIGEQIQRLFGNAEQLQALLDAHPRLGEVFPGGIAQLQELARQEPHQIVEALMAMVGGEGGAAVDGEHGRMPGGEEVMGEERDRGNLDEDEGEVWRGGRARDEEREVQNGDDDDDDDDDDEQASLPVRILQNLFGRFFWGRAVQNETRRSDSEDGSGDLPAAARHDDVD